MRTLLLTALLTTSSFASDECKLLVFQSVNEIMLADKMAGQSLALLMTTIDAPAEDYCLASKERRKFDVLIAGMLRGTVSNLVAATHECPAEEIEGIKELLEAAKAKLREVDHTQEDELMSVDQCK